MLHVILNNFVSCRQCQKKTFLECFGRKLLKQVEEQSLPLQSREHLVGKWGEKHGEGVKAVLFLVLVGGHKSQKSDLECMC